MKKVVYDRDNYFIGKDSVYLEMQNTKEYIDEDGVKRIVIELKDKEKINKILDLEKNSIPDIFEKNEPIEVVFEPKLDGEKQNEDIPTL